MIEARCRVCGSGLFFSPARHAGATSGRRFFAVSMASCGRRLWCGTDFFVTLQA